MELHTFNTSTYWLGLEKRYWLLWSNLNEKKHVTSDQTVILNELDSMISKLVGMVARLVIMLGKLVGIVSELVVNRYGD